MIIRSLTLFEAVPSYEESVRGLNIWMIGYDIKGLMLRFAANVKYRGDRMWIQESLTQWLALHETALPIICSEFLPAVHRGSY